MSEEKFKDRYRIPSTRAPWHDYLGGAYFVTICTKDREFFLGKIEDGQMHLSEIGKYADEQFRDVSLYYPYAEIPSYVLMPNHIHAIVIINERHDICRDAIHRVSTPYDHLKRIPNFNDSFHPQAIWQHYSQHKMRSHSYPFDLELFCHGNAIAMRNQCVSHWHNVSRGPLIRVSPRQGFYTT